MNNETQKACKLLAALQEQRAELLAQIEQLELRTSVIEAQIKELKFYADAEAFNNKPLQKEYDELWNKMTTPEQ